MKHNPDVDMMIQNIEVMYTKRVLNSMSEFDDMASAQLAVQRMSESTLFSLNAGGKRIRPRLLLEMTAAYSGDIQKAETFALAIEMIHTYSLIHDDLPSMDNDDLRRGKPTNHKMFGEDMAILAGDALFNLASEWMLEAIALNDGDAKMIFAMREILKASGSRGMILGQVADIKYHENTITADQLDFINAHKTGKLLTAAIVSGAIIGGADEHEIEMLRSIGYDMGLLFQIVDDVLDVTGDEAVLGKRVQIDKQNHKVTYPSLLGLEGAQMEIRKLSLNIEKKIDQLSIDPTFLRSVTRFLVERKY